MSFFDIIPVTESIFFSSQNIEFNIKDWKREPGKNILLVTGFSGSGKSTLAREYMEKYDAIVFELDSLDNNNDPHNTMILEKLKRNKRYKEIIERRSVELHTRYTRDEYRNMILKVISIMNRYPKQLFILEGIQIYTYLDIKTIDSLPIVIKGTSMVRSMYRRFGRDKKQFIKELATRDIFKFFEWYISDQKDLNMLEEGIRERRNK